MCRGRAPEKTRSLAAKGLEKRTKKGESQDLEVRNPSSNSHEAARGGWCVGTSCAEKFRPIRGVLGGCRNRRLLKTRGGEGLSTNGGGAKAKANGF